MLALGYQPSPSSLPPSQQRPKSQFLLEYTDASPALDNSLLELKTKLRTRASNAILATEAAVFLCEAEKGWRTAKLTKLRGSLKRVR